MNTLDSIKILDQPQIHQVLFFPLKLPKPACQDPYSLFFEVETGVQIGCRFYPADNSNQSLATILFFHGNGEVAPDYDEIAPLFNKQKLNLLVTDYRGYGYSDGTPTIADLLKDSQTLFLKTKQWLREKGHMGPLFVMGRSLGSLCATEIAFHHQDEFSGLILESGSATNFRNYLALHGLVPFDHPVWNEGRNFFNKEKIRLVRIPTLIIHAELDSLIPLSEAQIMFENSGAQNKKLVVIPGADHNDLMFSGLQLYFQSLNEFIRG
jgi:alpha-beta hydrolase superfamily lysophospholipase